MKRQLWLGYLIALLTIITVFVAFVGFLNLLLVVVAVILLFIVFLLTAVVIENIREWIVRYFKPIVFALAAVWALYCIVKFFGWF